MELTDGKLMPEGQAGADAGFMAEEVEKTVTQQMYPEVSGPVWQVGQMQKLKSGVQIYEVFGFVDGRLKAVGQILPGFSLLLVDSGSFVNAVPEDFAPGYSLTPLEDDIEATVANGIKLDCYGMQTLCFQFLVVRACKWMASPWIWLDRS